MKSRWVLPPQTALWGMCVVGLVWLAATVIFEYHLGWPSNGAQFGKRVIGWSVECWLAWTLARGAGRLAGRTG